MKHTRSFQLFCAALLCAGCAGAPEQSTENRQLINAARDWLILLDDQRYQDAWRHSAGYFKRANTEDELLRFGVEVRRPLGHRASREVWQQAFHEELRGRDSGRFFLVSFRTNFEDSAAAAFEHLILENEAGAWSVAGYSFRGPTTHHFAAFEQASPAQMFDTVRAVQPAALQQNR